MILDAIHFNFVLAHLVNGTKFNPLVLSSTWTHGHLCLSACLHGPHSLNRWKGPLSGLHCVYTWCWMSIRVLHCTGHCGLVSSVLGIFQGNPTSQLLQAVKRLSNGTATIKRFTCATYWRLDESEAGAMSSEKDKLRADSRSNHLCVH